MVMQPSFESKSFILDSVDKISLGPDVPDVWPMDSATDLLELARSRRALLGGKIINSYKDQTENPSDILQVHSDNLDSIINNLEIHIFGSGK